MKVAHDSKHLILVGITPEYIGSLLFLDSHNREVLCHKQLMHSLPYKIKDVCFEPGLTRKFVTCGLQHINFWSFNSYNMENTVGELTIPKMFTGAGQGVYTHDKNSQAKVGLHLVCQEAEMQSLALK